MAFFWAVRMAADMVFWTSRRKSSWRFDLSTISSICSFVKPSAVISFVVFPKTSDTMFSRIL